MPFNIEIKARCSSSDQDRIRRVLEVQRARFVGEDHQIDTYFVVAKGRLKLREGSIETALIHYEREDREGPKASRVLLYQPTAPLSLKEILTRALGVLTVVDKRREIYFIGTVKIHLDRVVGLGSFVEIEAIDDDGSIGPMRLQQQCEDYLALFTIPHDHLVAHSYSDMLGGKT